MKELARQFKEVASHNIILPILGIEIEGFTLINFMQIIGLGYAFFICLFL